MQVLDHVRILMARFVVLLLLAALCGCCLAPCVLEDQAAAECCRNQLQPGQFYCVQPPVDPLTQSLSGCTSSGWLDVACYAAPNVSCCGVQYNESQCVFTMPQRCRYVEGQRYNYYIAVALSLFLGVFGIDRFYLGYPAIGLLKLCTLGFVFIGHLIDFLLILLQVVGPANRSSYYVPFYGPLLMEVNSTDPFLPVSGNMCATP